MPTIQRWGNSLALRIPASAADQLGIVAGTEVDLVIRDEELVVVRPWRRTRYRLKEMLKDCRPSQLHGEDEFGDPIGREVVD